jgi:hypothetical protein
MMRLILYIFLFAISLKTFAQKKNKYRLGPLPCLDYKYQNLNQFGFYLGIVKVFKRHTYIGIIPGVNMVRFNKLSYLSPSVFLDYYYQPKILKGYIGPVFRLGFNPVKITGQKANYIWLDIGVRVPGGVIFGGYNYCLDKNEIKEISKFRVGYRFL